MQHDIASLRALVNQLTEDQFRELCEDHFPYVSNQLATGMTRSHMVRLLLEFAQKQMELDTLVDAIKPHNPKGHEKYVQQFSAKASAPAAIQACDVLIVAANPRQTPPLRLQQEVELIRARLQETEVGQRYRAEAMPAVRVDDLSRLLLQADPLIVHFCGHGGPEGEIILENDQGQPHGLTPEALGGLFAAVRGRVECVLLNLCYSIERADALLEQVPTVIGMEGPVEDQAARTFASGFYRGLAARKGYRDAFEVGRAEIAIANLPTAAAPRLAARVAAPGVLAPALAGVMRSAQLPKARATTPYYPLWFGTDREPNDEADLTKGFSSIRDKRIHYGTCRVAVPRSHKIGSTGSGFWKRLVTGTDDRLQLDSTSLHGLGEDAFWKSLRETLQTEHDKGERMAMLFIHGFRVTFEGAAQIAAQIGFDLQVPGVMAFFSWPSKGKLFGYGADAASIEVSEEHIVHFLERLVRDSSAEKVHVIAHSMGNRGLLRSVKRVVDAVADKTRKLFNQIFLAAPDEDRDFFLQHAGAYVDAAERTTLYVSAKDWALTASGLIYQDDRAGFTPPVTVVDGIDTVDVTKIDMSSFGHGYYAQAEPVLRDMHALMWHDQKPQQRFAFERQRTESGKPYWVI
jgi:esterase/lipase superfamily enzyme